MVDESYSIWTEQETWNSKLTYYGHGSIIVLYYPNLAKFGSNISELVHLGISDP